jgi:hypothetical protein
VCSGSAGAMVALTNVYDANFGKYEIGQLVLITIGSLVFWYQFNCADECIMDSEIIENFIISPIHATGAMRLPTEDTIKRCKSA